MLTYLQLLVATMSTVLVILAAGQNGTDRDIWDVHSPTFENTALMAWLAELAFVFSTCCCKVSVLFFFRRLSKKEALGGQSKPHVKLKPTDIC